MKKKKNAFVPDLMDLKTKANWERRKISYE